MRKAKLTGSERQILANISGVLHANPFSDKRIAADQKIAVFPSQATYTERYMALVEAIAREVNGLVSAGKGNIQVFEGRDRALVEELFIYHVYNQHFLRFDTMIESQIAQGDTPCDIPFAEEVLAMITRFGFTPEDALHYFAVYFQLRRAYFFILQSIIGRSPCMKSLRESLWNNVVTADISLYARSLWNRLEDYSTLLLGETGTGKGICARAIGQSGYIPFNRGKKRFAESFCRAYVYLNLSQNPEQLIESELFGHKKGAFTGAVADYDGALSRCSSYGAILLDEIGEVTTPVQVKLLNVLENRAYSPIGSHEKKRFPGRVIAATNRPLDRLRSEKIFRDDFYYRLCSDVIQVPPLRQRIRENPLELDDLIQHMVKRIVGEQSEDAALTVLDTIRKQVPADYAWPGNVRELEQCIRRILLKRHYEADTISTPQGDIESRIIAGVRDGSMDAQKLLSHYCALLYEKHNSYEVVARYTALDRRTAKKYIDQWYQNSNRRPGA